MPTVSIVVPCFNAADTLAETLASLRAQSVTDWEMLCVDDGSTDATPEMLAHAARADARIRVIANTGKGPSRARNLGVAEARGSVIGFCDADDLWAPDKLRLCLAALADPAVDAVFARIAFLDGARTSKLSTVPSGDLSVPTLLGENPVCTMSNLVVRRAAFVATGGFDTGMVHNEDLEWLIRLVGQGSRVIGLDRTLVRYRTSVSGLSSDLAAMRAGRDRAIATAARHGFVADARSEAIHLRYLARRALRVGAPGAEALRLAAAGLATSPAGFLSDLRRGGLTALGALLSPLMPARLRRALFAS
ncbi:putative glycosyltransferase EpsJ [Roseivivax jejudonensis]|uniref:Putative glycosyltransferase EpsJ n=1 Tax=Roseivivax jejudonensis TaxID=1529041 RepID=A0A1X6Y532_9RHOB|nr:glycosyltransferase family 2 protein [Roseivivax jejudonensis]SLN10167.1 putative glycosyltransferase EpsJ [Roseivivax jejudonensis]